MKRRKSSKKVGFDSKVMGSVFLAGLIVALVPPVFSRVTGKTFSGVTEEVIGAGAGVLTGYLGKSSNVLNASLGVAGSDIVNGVIAPKILSMTSNLPAINQGNAQVDSSNVNASDFVSLPTYRMSEYVGAGSAGKITPFKSYQESYRQN